MKIKKIHAADFANEARLQKIPQEPQSVMSEVHGTSTPSPKEVGSQALLPQAVKEAIEVWQNEGNPI